MPRRSGAAGQPAGRGALQKCAECATETVPTGPRGAGGAEAALQPSAGCRARYSERVLWCVELISYLVLVWLDVPHPLSSVHARPKLYMQPHISKNQPLHTTHTCTCTHAASSPIFSIGSRRIPNSITVHPRTLHDQPQVSAAPQRGERLHHSIQCPRSTRRCSFPRAVCFALVQFTRAAAPTTMRSLECTHTHTHTHKGGGGAGLYRERERDRPRRGGELS